MKNKLTLILCVFFISYSFSLKTNAQQEKNQRSIFDLEIVSYSDKPDSDIEHYHMLQIANNSNKANEFELFVKPINCKDEYNDVIRNKRGSIDNTKEDSALKKNNRKGNSSLNFEIYSKDLSKKLNKVLLKPKESLNFYLKITRENNSEIGQWKCSKIVAKVSNNKGNNIKKSVIIKSLIPDSNNKGH